MFEQRNISLSKAALIILHRMGYNWSTVNGHNFWKFNNETIVARRLRLESNVTKRVLKSLPD